MDETAQAEEIDVRPMTAEDAVGLVELVRACYGEEYVHDEIYHPDRFFAAQERGEHISEVAVTADGKVVGHWAFSFHGPRVAESGMTITHPDYRGHGIATEMEQNLLRRLEEMGVRWIMGEPVLFHTATQAIVLQDWNEAAITGFRLKVFHSVSGVGGFSDELEEGRISAAMAFCPMASMAARSIWVSPAYRPLLTQALEPTSWPRVLEDSGAEGAPGGASVLETGWDEINRSASIVVRRIGADLEESVAAARDQATARGARFIELKLPVSSPDSADVDLRGLGFSYAAFLPEMADDGDVMLLQWLDDPLIDRGHWHLLNDEIEALADMVIAQAAEAYEMSQPRS